MKVLDDSPVTSSSWSSEARLASLEWSAVIESTTTIVASVAPALGKLDSNSFAEHSLAI